MNTQEYETNWETTKEIIGKGRNNLVDQKICSLYDISYEWFDSKKRILIFWQYIMKSYNVMFM